MKRNIWMRDWEYFGPETVEPMLKAQRKGGGCICAFTQIKIRN